MESTNPEVELIKDPKPDQRCSFCFSAVNNHLRYGDMYKYKNIMAHYFCVLMSSQLQQNGEDSDGFFGFLIEDLLRELDRAKSVKCCFCKRGGATAQCNIKVKNRLKCANTFHFTCGITHGTLHYFFGKFQSLCHIHRRPQKIPEEFVKDSATQCWICHDIIQDVNSSSSSLWAACCKKSYFHKDCIQHQAYVSGEYHFKCPLCNNHEKFKQAMLRCGIFLPIRDAEWEREPNAYSDLYREHNSCDMEPCLCPHSNKDGDTRKYNSGAWDLIRCSTCGSEGTHRPCSALALKGDVTWNCGTCRHVIMSQQKQANASNADDAGSSLALQEEAEPKIIEPDTCCADFCTCNKGREYRADKGMYRTIYCGDCEYSWIHARCRNVQFGGVDKGEWICVGCQFSDSEESDTAPASSRAARTASAEEKISILEKTKKQVSSPCYVVLEPLFGRYFYKTVSHVLSRNAYLRVKTRHQKVIEKLALMSETDRVLGSVIVGEGDGTVGTSQHDRIDKENQADLKSVDNTSSNNMSSGENNESETVCMENDSSFDIAHDNVKEYDVDNVKEVDNKEECSSTIITDTSETDNKHEKESKVLAEGTGSFLSLHSIKSYVINNLLRSLSPLKAARSDETNTGIQIMEQDDELFDSGIGEMKESVDISDTTQKDVCASQDNIFAIGYKKDEIKIGELCGPIDTQDLGKDSVGMDQYSMKDSEALLHSNNNNNAADDGFKNSVEPDDGNILETVLCNTMDIDLDSAVNNNVDLCEIMVENSMKLSTNNKRKVDLNNTENRLDSFKNSMEPDDSNILKTVLCNTMDIDLDSAVNNNVDLCNTMVENSVKLSTNNKRKVDLNNTENSLDVGDKQRVVYHEPGNELDVVIKEGLVDSECQRKYQNSHEIYRIELEYSSVNEEVSNESKYESQPVVEENRETLTDGKDNLEIKMKESRENVNECKEVIEFPLEDGTKIDTSILESNETLLKKSEVSINYETEETGFKEEKNVDVLEAQAAIHTKDQSKSDIMSEGKVTIDKIFEFTKSTDEENPDSLKELSFSVSNEKSDNDNKIDENVVNIKKMPDRKVKQTVSKSTETPFILKKTIELSSNIKQSLNSSMRHKRKSIIQEAQNTNAEYKTELVGVKQENNKVHAPETRTMMKAKDLYCESDITDNKFTIDEIFDLVNTPGKEKPGVIEQANLSVSNQKSNNDNKFAENVKMSTEKTPDSKKVKHKMSKSTDKKAIPFSTKKIYEYFTSAQTSMNYDDESSVSRNTSEIMTRKRFFSEEKCEEPRMKRQRLIHLSNTSDNLWTFAEDDQKPVVTKRNPDGKQNQTPRKRNHKSVLKEDTTSRKIYEFFSVQNPIAAEAKHVKNENALVSDIPAGDAIYERATSSFALKEETTENRSVRPSTRTRRSGLTLPLSNTAAASHDASGSKEKRTLKRKCADWHPTDENYSPNKQDSRAMNQSPSLKRTSRRLSVARKDLSLFL